MNDDYEGVKYKVTSFGSPEKEISKLWAKKYDDCSATRTKLVPLSKIETKALKIADYKKKDIGDLYAFCAENDKDDYYAEGGNRGSSEQVREVKGWLAFCPNHPLAKEWRKFIDPNTDISVSKFDDGTYVVNEEIKPGRYYANEGDNCYWERDRKSGDIIDNHISKARRTEVTIKKTDYSFSSERCGTWRRVR